LIRRKDRLATLRYCSRFLENSNAAVAEDAFYEFDRLVDQDVRAVARRMSPARLRAWVFNDEIAPHRVRLYAYLLGHCGEAKDAALLRLYLDGQRRRGAFSHLDGALTGYTLLNPQAGWAYTRDLIKDPKHDFMLRYAGLRSVRDLFAAHPGVVAQKDLLAGLGLLIAQDDMADLPIEFLRRQKCWKLTDQVLGLQDKTAFKVPIIRRAVVRYALRCPEAEARRFVTKVRNSHPTLVKDQEELLKLEEESAAKP
jgi:hypothetical protein